MRIRSLLTAAALATAALLAATGAAAAPDTPRSAVASQSAAAETRAGAAYNVRTLLLRFPAPPGAVSCKSRDIDIINGTYHWRSENTRGLNTYREIYLPRDRYTWSDCITYWSGDGIAVYLHRSALVRHSNGVRFELALSEIHNSYRPGLVSTQYGSSLRFVR
jgi:hypothetical protein